MAASGGATPDPARARSRWDVATAVLLASLVVLALATFRDYGPTFDADRQRRIGQAVLAWYASGFSDRTALGGGEDGNHHLYGGAFEALAEAATRALPLDPFEARHLANVLVALLGVVGAARLGRRLSGPRAGFLAAALLAATPAWWGHGFGNSKDIPYAAPLPWLLLALLQLGDADRLARWRWRGAAGVALGLGVGLRPGSLGLLLLLVAGTLLGRAHLGSSGSPRRRTALAAAGRDLAAVVAVGLAVSLVGWPYGQTHPLSGFLAAAREASRIPQYVVVRFAGEWVSSLKLPRSYLPTWLAFTLPETWAFAAGAGALAVAGAVRRRSVGPRGRDALVALAWGAIPLLLAVAFRPTLYDGYRHLLFVLPPLASVGGACLDVAFERSRAVLRRAAVVALGAAGVAVVGEMVALHPYEYVYFNRLVAGGVAAQAGRFDLEYHGASYREGMRWAVANLAGVPGRPLRLAVEARPFLASHWIAATPGAAERLAVVDRRQADVFVTSGRWNGFLTPGRVLHEVSREGVPLLRIIELDPPELAGRRLLAAPTGTAELRVPPGWQLEPIVRPGEAGIHYILEPPAGMLEVDLLLLDAADPGVPPPDQAAVAVEEATVAAAAAGAAAPPPLPLTPIRGPGVSGWVGEVTATGHAGPERRRIGLAHLGGIAASFEYSIPPGEEEAGARAIEALATLRTAP